MNGNNNTITYSYSDPNHNNLLVSKPENLCSWAVTSTDFTNSLYNPTKTYINSVGYADTQFSPSTTKSFTIPIAAHINTLKKLKETILKNQNISSIEKEQNFNWIPKTQSQVDITNFANSHPTKKSSYFASFLPFNISNAISRDSTQVLDDSLNIKISKSQEDINKFLRENNSKMEMTSTTDNSLSKLNLYNVALIYDLNLKWPQTMNIIKDKISFNIYNDFEVLLREPRTPPGTPINFLIKLKTSSPKHNIFILPHDNIAYTPEDPYMWVREIMNMNRERNFYTKLTPLISYIKLPNTSIKFNSQVPSISGMCMPITSQTQARYSNTSYDPILLYSRPGTQTFCINETLQEVNFRMDNTGIHNKNTTTTTSLQKANVHQFNNRKYFQYMESFNQKRELNIDSNFLIWIENTDVPYPVFVAYSDRQTWDK